MDNLTDSRELRVSNHSQLQTHLIPQVGRRRGEVLLSPTTDQKGAIREGQTQPKVTQQVPTELGLASKQASSLNPRSSQTLSKARPKCAPGHPIPAGTRTRTGFSVSSHSSPAVPARPHARPSARRSALRLRSLINLDGDVFQRRLRPGPPAACEPISLQLEPCCQNEKAPPFRACALEGILLEKTIS